MGFIFIEGFAGERRAPWLIQRMTLDQRSASILPWAAVVVGLAASGLLAALRPGTRRPGKIAGRAFPLDPAVMDQPRIPGACPPDNSPVVVAFNAAFDRIETESRATRAALVAPAAELRMPLATLRAQVESLTDPEDRKDALEEVDRLSRLVAQLLALTEADSDSPRPKATFDLVAVARDITGHLSQSVVANHRGMAFESAHARWLCFGRPALVEGALRNLLEHAIRHTPRGCEILVAIDKSGRLVVSDDGLGARLSVHDRFVRRFGGTDGRGSGASLELSIVRRVMDLHGGEARLDPSAHGTRFILDFSGRGKAPPSTARTLRRPLMGLRVVALADVLVATSGMAL